MDYREIVSVTGIGGLFQLMATKSDGAIVRNLADKSTKFIPARLHNVTPLESIEVYTTGENVRLHEVFEKMKANEGIALPDPKKADSNTIKSYFKQIFPEFDDERVYVSDMKKMLRWFDILKDNDLLNLDFYKQQENAEANDAVTAGADEVPAAEPSEEKTAKKARAKKSAEESAAAENEEKPKKTARKKKTEEAVADGAEKPAKKPAKKKTTEE